MIRFLEHRIGDRRTIRLVQKWLKAGVLEDGVVSVSGMPMISLSASNTRVTPDAFSTRCVSG
jgi:hypothetical protein